MSEDINIRIVKKDRDTNTWKEVKLYSKKGDDFYPIEAYSFRNYELFDILKGNKDDLAICPIDFNSLSKEVKEEIQTYEDLTGFYDFKEINLADLKVYFLEHPKVIDLDYYSDDDNDPKKYKDNPVKNFIDRIEQYIDFAEDGFYIPHSDIKIIYWFDC